MLHTHAPPQRWNPVLQAKSQLVPSHVAVAFVGAGHGAHEVPQLAGSMLLAQRPAHAWEPELQWKPHTPEEQVAVPESTIGQTFEQEPQRFGSLEVSTHMRSHLAGVMPEQPLAHA